MIIKKASQKGFTLIELLIALAVGSLLLAGLSGALYQLLATSSSSTNNMMALNQVQNTGYWISRDIQQSKIEDTIIDSDSQTPEIFYAIWDELSFDTELEKSGHKVIYRLENGNLYRDYYITEVSLPFETAVEDYIYSLVKTTLIAKFIDSSLSLVKNETVILNVSATIDGWKTGSAERTFIIENRVS